MTLIRTENLGDATAFVLHRPHSATQSLLRQLHVIGLNVHETWPELPAEAMMADFVFYDADMAHEGQFPWAPGASPMPMIALIGSEAPGRLRWAMTMGAHAQLLKPVTDKGIYAALLVARSNFDRTNDADARISDLQARLSARQTVVQAVMIFVLRGKSQTESFEILRQTAMAWQVTIEEAAQRLVANHSTEKVSDDSERIDVS